MTTREEFSISPGFIARFGGLPYATLQIDESAPALAAWRQLTGLRAQVKAAVGLLGDDLYRRIAASTGETKVAYIQLRRDIHNARWPRVERALTEWGAELALTAEITRLLALVQAQERLRDRLDALLPDHLVERLEQWRVLFCASDVSKTMVLSAPDFWPRLNEDQQALFTAAGLTKTGFTLLQYLSRCCTKTSPFSFFCPSAYGVVADSRADPNGPSCELQLNSQALINTGLLIPRLIERYERRAAAEANYALEWNSSFQQIGERYLWLMQRSNYDTIRQMRAPQDSGLKALLSDLTGALQAGTSLPETSGLSTETHEALLHAGILSKVAYSQDALTTEIDFYLQPEQRPPPAEQETEPFAARYREAIVAFRRGALDARFEALRQISTFFQSFGRPTAPPQTAAPGQKDAEKQILREDVVLSGQVHLPRTEIEPTLRALSRLQETFAPITPMQVYRHRLALFYREFFGTAVEVPLLAFLQKLFERFKSSEKQGQENQPIDLSNFLLQAGADSEAHHAYRAELERELVAKAAVDTARGAIDLLPALRADFARPAESASISGAYLQRVPSTGTPRWMVNNLGAGTGKAIRRWCVYNPDFAQTFKQWVGRVQTPDTLDVIILDDVTFHADRGPRFFSYYFDLPGVHHIEPGLRPVSLRNCCVYVDEEGLLAIRTHQGQAIFAHYDSLLRITVRPFTTQFLAMFGRPNWTFPLPTVSNFAYKVLAPAKMEAGSPAVWHRPRLELGEHTVLTRASWTVPPEAWPNPAQASSLSAIVEAYAEWKERQGLPDRVFVRLRPPPGDKDKIGDAKKPQYLDLSDPVWIFFLHKYLSRYKGTLFFEEALPDRSAAMSPLEGRATELVVHWRYPAGADEA